MKNAMRGTMLGAAALAVAILTGCNGGGGGGGGGAAARGPADAAAFAGVTIEVNPTLTFQAGGNVTYENDDTTGAFPAAASAVAGTFTYAPSGDFTTGTLSLQFPAPLDTLQLTLSNFTIQSGNVTAFRATYNGAAFNATVTNGTLAQAPAPNTGGGGGAGEQPATALPAGVQGTYNMTFDLLGPSGSGIADGNTETFVIGASSLAFAGKTLTNPVFLNGNTHEWIFKDGNLWYAVSQTSGGTLNEINVAGSGGNPFYGQYNVTGGGNGGGGNTGGGSITLKADGNLPAGTSVTLTMTHSSTMPPGTPAPSGVPTFNNGQQVTFTVNAAGNLVVGGTSLSIPFVASITGGTTYVQAIGITGDTNGGSLTLNPTTNQPIGATVSFRRGTSQITYGFTN